MQFGVEYYIIGPHLHTKFGPDVGWGRVQEPPQLTNLVKIAVFCVFPGRLFFSPLLSFLALSLSLSLSSSFSDPSLPFSPFRQSSWVVVNVCCWFCGDQCCNK